MRVFNIFKIQKEERWLAILMLVFLCGINAVVVAHYYDVFTIVGGNYQMRFIRQFVVSGFDPITYDVISDWSARYNVYRHPLLAFYMFIPYLINQGLMAVTGLNCALFLAVIMQVLCAFYAAIFLSRIFREAIGLSSGIAFMLTFFYFSFAYIMVSAIVPDHFIISMMLLLLALYVSGRRMRSGRPLKAWQTALYFVLTAGTTLNNGLKIFLSGLFVNGKKFFRIKYLLFGVIIPAALLWGFARFEYKKFVWPGEMARKEAKAKKKAAEERKKKEIQLAEAAKVANKDAVSPKDSVKKDSTKPKRRVVKKVTAKQGAPFMSGEFMRWSDATTSRTESLVENLMGEGIQLHQDYLLCDGLRYRPLFVHYNWWISYVVEAIIGVLFMVGIWFGRRSKFFWMVMSYFALDMALHMGLGFGLNEVYIMTAHWAYVIPIAVAFLMKNIRPQYRWYMVVLVALLTIYLLGYNTTLLVSHFV